MKRHRPKAGSSVSSPVVGGPSSSSPSGPVVRSLVVPSSLVRGLVVLLGFFFGLCLLKFGNPPIMEKFVEAPKGAFELLAMTPWPLRWAYWLLGSLTLLGLILVF